MNTNANFVIIVRHGKDALDDAWELTKQNPSMLGVQGRGPEKNIPAINLGLRDYEVLAQKIFNDDPIASALCYMGLTIYSSCKLRARQSTEAFHTYLWERFRGSMALQAIHKEEALDGRNYGFTWHRTEAGLKVLLPEEEYALLERDPFNYRPPGGENWPDVVERVTNFIQKMVINSPRNMVLMSHHELAPIIEDVLQGDRPNEATIKRADTHELDNATARVWYRKSNRWQIYKTISGRQERDYSQEEDAIAWRLPPAYREVVDLDQVRHGQLMRA